jgi:hypothetical protein
MCPAASAAGHWALRIEPGALDGVVGVSGGVVENGECRHGATQPLLFMCLFVCLKVGQGAFDSAPIPLT